MGRDVLVKFTSYRYKHLIVRARSGLKNKDAARLGPSPAGAVRQPESAAAATATAVPSPTGRVYVTFRASLSGTFLQTLPDLVTPLKGHSLSPRSCPATRSAPSERFGY